MAYLEKLGRTGVVSIIQQFYYLFDFLQLITSQSFFKADKNHKVNHNQKLSIFQFQIRYHFININQPLKEYIDFAKVRMVKQQSKQIEERRILKRITNKRIINGDVEYFVKWKGMPEGTGDWLPASSLVKCFKKVTDFQQNVWKYKKREQIRRRLALIKALQQKKEYDQKGLDIAPLKQKLNQIQISQQSSFSDSEAVPQTNIHGQSAKFQQNTVYSKQKIQVARFDCITGQWKNCYYTPQELKEIYQLRNRYAQDYCVKNVVIKNIIKINGQQIVQYEMAGQKYQCLLKSFQFFMPQLLLSFLLEYYNPAKHELVRPECEQISQCSSISQFDQELPQRQSIGRK